MGRDLTNTTSKPGNGPRLARIGPPQVLPFSLSVILSSLDGGAVILGAGAGSPARAPTQALRIGRDGSFTGLPSCNEPRVVTTATCLVTQDGTVIIAGGLVEAKAGGRWNTGASDSIEWLPPGAGAWRRTRLPSPGVAPLVVPLGLGRVLIASSRAVDLGDAAARLWRAATGESAAIVDLSAGEQQAIPAPDGCVLCAGGAYLDGRVVSVGGAVHRGDARPGVVQVFDAGQYRWDTVATLPSAMTVTTARWVGEDLVIVGDSHPKPGVQVAIWSASSGRVTRCQHLPTFEGAIATCAHRDGVLILARPASTGSEPRPPSLLFARASQDTVEVLAGRMGDKIVSMASDNEELRTLGYGLAHGAAGERSWVQRWNVRD